MVKGIIFDMDGVVIDSNHIHYKYWNNYFERAFGITIPQIEFASRLGESSLDFAEYFIKRYNLNIGLRKLREDMDKEYDNYVEEIVLKKGFLQVLKKLAEKYKIALATGADMLHANLTLEKFRIKTYFDFVIAGNCVKKAKPDPEIFLKAAEGMNLKPEDCLVIEDAQMGLAAAKRAGMKCIVVPDNMTNIQDFSRADKMLGSIDELTESLIEGL